MLIPKTQFMSEPGSVHGIDIFWQGGPQRSSHSDRMDTSHPVTAAWIAEHLHMGTRGHLTHLLYHRHRPSY